MTAAAARKVVARMEAVVAVFREPQVKPGKSLFEDSAGCSTVGEETLTLVRVWRCMGSRTAGACNQQPQHAVRQRSPGRLSATAQTSFCWLCSLTPCSYFTHLNLKSRNRTVANGVTGSSWRRCSSSSGHNDWAGRHQE